MKHTIYKTIRGRFIILVILLIFILSIGTVTFSYLVFYNNLKQATMISTKSSLEFISNDLDGKLSEINNSLFWCQTNRKITDYVITSNKDKSYNKMASMAKACLDDEVFYNHANPYIVRLIVANSSQSHYIQSTSTTYSVDKPMVSIIKELPFYESAIKKDEFNLSSQIQNDPFLYTTLPVITVIRPIYNPYNVDVIGFVYLEINVSLFQDAFREYLSTDNNPIYLTIDDHTYRFTANHFEECTSVSNLPVITVPLGTKNCSISQEVSKQVLKQHLVSYIILVIGILIVIIFIGILLFFILSRLVNTPVRRLRMRLALIAKGDFSIDPSIEWDNEFGDIGKNVNMLAHDIDSLMKTRIEDEKQKKDYEYRMLQSQINPHFLYNTLNSIKWMATIQNSPGIAEMVTSLSRLLKNIAKGKNSIVSLKDEIALLDDYFLIQKYRYGGAITLDYKIDEEDLLKNEIPRFTLQPIVENAIFHGIEPKGQNGHITIHIFAKNDTYVQIDITDDGIGMGEETIQELLTNDVHDKVGFFKDVGISSVNKRLKYMFGESSGISIQSEVGIYTTMSITIPLRESER